MSFLVSDRAVGRSEPAYVVAEACDNHLGSREVACEMIRRAKLAGADAIKFQHHLADEEMLPDVPQSDNFQMPLYEFLQRYALTLDDHQALKAYAESLGITYLCTPFSWKAAQELEEFVDPPAYKIGSGEMTDIPTLMRIADFGKPMIISTGMSTFDEVDRTADALNGRVPLALLHCVSEYPPVYTDLNIGVIPAMLERYPDVVIGHSDHTPDLVTSFAAVTVGARIVEKHVILDKLQPGPDQAVSIEFDELADLVRGIRRIEQSLGTRKEVHEKERQIRSWAFRSLVTTRSVGAGEVLDADTVWSKRPGTGIPSHRMSEVVGRVTARDITANTLIAWDDLAPAGPPDP